MDNVEIDYWATTDPIIRNGFIGIFLSGEVHPKGKHVPFIS